MEDFFHLHPWGVVGFDAETKIKDRGTTPILLENVGLEIDYWPPDDLFSVSPLLFVTERLRSTLINKKLTGLTFEKVERISKGANFRSNFPDAQLPPFYWQLKIYGQVPKDDFALWRGTYLVISGKALEHLRNNFVTHAEADLIKEPLDKYFASEKKYFWMSDNARAYFLKMEKRKQQGAN